MPSDKRARQRAEREARLAAEAKQQKRRKQIRNGSHRRGARRIIVGIVFLVSGTATRVGREVQGRARPHHRQPGRVRTPSCRPRRTRSQSRRGARPRDKADSREQQKYPRPRP